MKQNAKGFNLYIFVILGLLFILIYINMQDKNNTDYTRANLMADIAEEKVAEIIIHPNREAPTGYLEVILTTGEDKILYATDIVELEELIRGYGVEPSILDIQREKWFFTYVLPILVIVIVGVFLFVMLSAQNSGGGSSGKMMNFGKSRMHVLQQMKWIKILHICSQ